ncbi:ferric reductase NAD binding domain-containing protein [Ilyonectria robusta]|uniref:ferric reductase NAD binding domain-containing protein n=1 Tax=Ilyonectria robusta TaxID=1079257 RepID=UPI001E8E52CB|nr:ferric reductase NAD binding domain-containing protein [Ilyonectria robusta]KAH8659044.1 ferric reductase NAD binding domain-containing protein [Ilyonectria robusta]
MALCVFLGLKNTPLAFLISAPYNYLNIFHRLVGFTSIFQVLLHTIFYMIYFGGQKGEWATLIEVENREGIVAGIIMLILLMGIFRHLNYELFYFMHIVAFMLTLILLALHRPDWKKKVPVAVVFIACTWGADRIIRGVRLLYNLANNSATIESLPDGGTRLILKKQLPGATPGKHCFVWIPAVRMCQTHPFTIVSNSTSGLELVMKSHKGFTKAALEFALSKAGHRVMASVDGPYGSLPNLSRYDKLILIAGGSGATFTFGLAANFVKHLETRSIESTQSMSFIWAVKKTNHLGWFKEHLSALKTQSSHVAVKLHVTGQELSSSPDLRIEKKSQEVTSNVTATKEHDSMNDNIEANTSGNSSDDSPDAVEFEEVVYGKMIPENTILEAMQHLNRNSRVLIAACGPVSLLDAVATTVGSLDVAEVPIIEVHYEKFDW